MIRGGRWARNRHVLLVDLSPNVRALTDSNLKIVKRIGTWFK